MNWEVSVSVQGDRTVVNRGYGRFVFLIFPPNKKEEKHEYKKKPERYRVSDALSGA